ncbi:MAG: hypothetical protein ACKO1Y_02920 [Actinomycetota bacterium]
MATILREDGPVEVGGEIAPGTVLLDPSSLAEAIGWHLEPEGLCRGDVCVPTKARPELRVGDRVDLRVAADLLQRPFAIDEETATVALGASVAAIAARLGDGHLDDLVLRDADGAVFEWGRIGRKKKLLVAWASW